jgi:diguanylate cyclase
MFGPIIEFLAQLLKTPQPAPATGGAAAAAVVCPEPSPLAVPPPVDPTQLHQVLNHVSQLTTAVVQDVGHHNKSIQDLSQELAAVTQNDPSAVAAIVCKLLVANQQLQGRLERAEATLQTHSRQLHDAVTTARTDALTNLMNRRALDEELNSCVRDFVEDGQTSTLMILDVDRFKQFNDTFGHLAGDKCLTHVAEALRSQAQSMDLVARFGGEEFVILFWGQSAADVRERAEAIRQTIGRRPMGVEGGEKTVTASGGLAEIGKGECVADWMKRADIALYAAKNGGRDCLYEQDGAAVSKVTCDPRSLEASAPPASATPRVLTECAAELAAEAFTDTSFVPAVARRIAEWRRGGTTLSVMLARLNREPADSESEENALQVPMRKAMTAARASVREMDMVTRWQSNGIAVLLPSTAATDTKAIVRRLKSLLATENAQQTEPLALSIGIAEGIEGNDARRVLERAWLALEAARVAGPGGVCVHDGLKCVNMKLSAVAR